MEENYNKILENFLNSSQELIDSRFTEELRPIRIEFLQEIGKPGCTPCIVNAAKRKFSERVKKVMDQKINVDKPESSSENFNPFDDTTIPSP